MGQAKQVHRVEALGAGVFACVLVVAGASLPDDKELHKQCDDKTGGAPGGNQGSQTYEVEWPECASCRLRACPVSCPNFLALWGKTPH